MTPQPISIRQPELDALVAGAMTVLIRPMGRLASVQPGDLLWVREPFHLPKSFNIHKPTRAVRLGATPTFITDHSPAWYAHHQARDLGRRRVAREMPKAWHRQHLRVTAIDRLPLHDVSDADIRTAGWRSRAAFKARWDEGSSFFGGRAITENRWDANPAVLRIIFERIPAPLPAPKEAT